MIRRQRAQEHEQGFTLVEVMVTIVVLGILFAIATSTWFGLVEARSVDSAANQLAADLRLAHSSATNQLAPWRVVYNSNGAPFACGGTPDTDYCLLKLNGSTVTQTLPRSLPDNTKIQATNLLGISPLPGFSYDRSMQFCADGSVREPCDSPPSMTAPRITVSAEDNNPNHIIEVTPATSRVRVDP
jgi:prepilin-type N-terminal cleavage/methylation domain-containing protein